MLIPFLECCVLLCASTCFKSLCMYRAIQAWNPNPTRMNQARCGSSTAAGRPSLINCRKLREHWIIGSRATGGLEFRQASVHRSAKFQSIRRSHELQSFKSGPNIVRPPW